MYSAVLMLALTAGTDSVDFGRRGGCNGCSGYGGCSGAVVSYGCTGGYGCSGSGCSGGRGGLFHRGGRGGCCGCCGGGVVYGCTGVSYGCTGGCGGVIVNPGVAPKTMPNPPETAPLPKKGVQAAVPANIIVSLPANASLTFDGAPTSSTSDRRSFVTPALEVGSTYVYTLRATVMNNGQAVEETQQVQVRGGMTSTVNFNFSSQGVASR